MKRLLLVFLVILQAIVAHSQDDYLNSVLDSIIETELNFELDTTLTKVEKPDPLLIVDGLIMEREQFLQCFKLEDIKSMETLSDSITFEIFDPPAWGGFIIVRTNLSKRRFKKRIDKNSS